MRASMAVSDYRPVTYVEGSHKLGRAGNTLMMVRLIHFYQRWVSPLLPPRCRFIPSCSEYAVIAIQEHGSARGSWLAARRLCKCQPFHPGGYDPVPTVCSADGQNKAQRSSTDLTLSDTPNTVDQ